MLAHERILLSSPREVVRESVRGSLTGISLILFLLLFSSLIGTRPVAAQPCGGHTGDLYDLPACAIDGTTGNLVDNAYLTSAEPQTVIALPDENVSFAITYQVWAPTNTCVGGTWFNSCFFALLFYPSWNHWPRGPGTEDFDKVIYNSAVPAGGPPGMKGSASIQVTTPINIGTYYLYFYIQPSLSYDYPVTAPRPPGYIKIIVATHTSTVTVTGAVPNGVAFSQLTIPVLATGVAGVAVAVALTSTVLVTRRRSRSARSRAGFANLDELLLTVDTEVPKQDQVLATVMFTDIVGSTEWAAKVGDREWRDLLNQHFDLIRKELDRFSGREVGTTGDGMLAVFAGPERAVRCACSIRDAVRSLGLEIRVGLHTG